MSFLTCSKKERNEYRKKEELIADTYTNLSHDIRTPLTSLDGYFQLIEECDNIDDQRRYLDIIREKGLTASMKNAGGTFYIH